MSNARFAWHPDAVSFANALRRSLMSDVSFCAPERLTVYTNTSSETDESIAHRIGMVPWKKKHDGENVHIHVRDRDVTSYDLCQHALYDVMLVRLDAGQEFKADIHFAVRKGSEHARYSSVAAVGYNQTSEFIEMRFECIDDQNPAKVLLNAVQSLRDRLCDVRVQLDALQGHKKT